ncbi:phosphotransferase [Nocardiopsis sp. NPDC049922]|uniref:phosphotransferase enzyme family protein n=1 Tax=Nocardiopsis sp. NPDC049922 TaxID=3155157 RepID=UPI0033E436D9
MSVHTPSVPAMVVDLCARAGLPTTGLQPLRHHATGVYLLTDPQIVVRISPAHHLESQRRALALTRWLKGHGVDVTAPCGLDQPVVHGDHLATFWAYYPQQGRPAPPPHHLGRILRRMHALADPPVELPSYTPLASLGRTLVTDTVLEPEDRDWLTERRHHLLESYARLDFPLGPPRWIHGDAYPGNTLWAGSRVLLGDWDEAARGPRELDLANTLHGQRRFGRTSADIDAFWDAYQAPPRTWPGWRVLLDIRDLHTLSAFLRRAARPDVAAHREVRRRLATLRAGDTTTAWTSA